MEEENLKVIEFMHKYDIAVIGGGPAGLSTANTAAQLLGERAKIIVIDENPKLGGQLIKQTHMFFGSASHYCGVRGVDIADILKEKVKEKNVETLLNTTVVGYYGDLTIGVHQLDNSDENFFSIKAKKIIVATGANEKILAFVNNDLPGIYGAGAVQTLMNVYGIRPGKKVLMIGSGNIGLIVSYQLMQTDVEMVGLVEAMDHIGGYLVHASKLARCDVPFYIPYSIKEALGEEEVSGAVIAKLDKRWNFIKGTEKKIECDTICLAVGLSPLSEFFWAAGCKLVYVKELGGYVAVHNDDMETTKEGIYLAGDVSGIEEAVTAMLEGRIAGAQASVSLFPEIKPKAEKVKERAKEELRVFRAGPFGEEARIGKEKIDNLNA